jgi:hypothetical protein
MPRRCKFEGGCDKQPYFNTSGEKSGLYCLEHKDDDMVDVIHKRCKSEGCNKQPKFNKPGETKGLYCVEHKDDGMIDVVNKRCKSEGCNRHPIYNKPGETKPLYCKDHKDDDMVDVVNKRCKFEGGCDKIPSYNTPEETNGLYCVKHKEVGMIDVKNKRCKFEGGCDKIPYYNTPGESKGLYCVKHKTDGMIDIKNKRCKSEGCIKQPTYNEQGETKGLYCLEHKEASMVDVVNKRCKNEWCDTFIQNSKYEGYCAYCFINMFPDKPISRNYKTKERAVTDYILKEYPNYNWICDKRIQDGCSKRRPDLMLDLGYQVIIIEVDENQHKSNYCSCEIKRLMEISQDINNRNLIVIRFNPDSYKTRENKTINSCWKINKGTGILIISSETNWNTRLKVLEETLKYWINNETNKMIECIELFYDGFE